MQDRYPGHVGDGQAPGSDPVVDAYKRHVDRTLLRQNLQRTVTERVENPDRPAAPGGGSAAGRTVPAERLLTDFEAVIRTFSEAGIEFVIVGGLAATIHGSARLTQDIDFVYSRSGANIDRKAVHSCTTTTCNLRGPCAPSVITSSTSPVFDGPQMRLTVRGIEPRSSRSRAHASSGWGTMRDSRSTTM